MHRAATPSQDFWGGWAPATNLDNVYSAEVYGSATVDVVEAGAKPGAKPFFVYLAFANTHEPLEAPGRFIDLYPKSMQSHSRMMLGAMVTAMDEAMGSTFTENHPSDAHVTAGSHAMGCELQQALTKEPSAPTPFPCVPRLGWPRAL